MIYGGDRLHQTAAAAARMKKALSRNITRIFGF